MSVWPTRPGNNAPAHTYDLFVEGSRTARLEWRTFPRVQAGWYLVRASEEERLPVDVAIDELARDERSSPHDWELHAQLAALLSTPLALDVAERKLHGRPERSAGRFRRRLVGGRLEIYVVDIDTQTLAYAVPELPLEAVSDVSVLSGPLSPEGFERVARRIALLGGRVVAVFRRDDGEAAP
jgi:hypothetical protein